MRKITLLMAFFVAAFMVKATVYLDETLNYTDGALKTNWTSAGTIGTWSSDFMVGSSALTYSNTGGEALLSGQGKSLTCDYQSPYGAANYYVYKSFSSSSVSTGTIYASFLYSPNGVDQNQSNATVFLLTGTSSTTGVSVFVGKALSPNDKTHFRFGTTRGSSTAADVKWSTIEFANADYASSVFFVVLKYNLDTQTSSIFINSVIGTATEPTADAFDNTSTSSAKTSLQVIQVKVNGNTKTVYKISGIKVVSTWAEAVAKQSTADPLAAPTVGTASSITAESFTANWTSIPNAVGYDVNLYLGAVLKGTFNVSGQAASSLVLKGLLTNTSYTYKVIAKGDGTSNSDSNESDASESFTTLEGLTSISTNFVDGTWGTLYTATADPGPIAPTVAGTYPSSSANGFDISNAYLYDISKYDLRGQRHDYGIRMDRQSFGGMIVLPTVKTIEQLEIHAIPGGAPRDFVVKELVNDVWTSIGTYTLTTSAEYKEFIIPISRNTPTKLRIENAGSGQITIYQIITRTTNPSSLDIPIVEAASEISSSGFTGNWTSVSNATGYVVRVYEAGVLKATVNVNGQSTISQNIGELTSETVYTYTVQAKGDGDVNYLDSFMSSAYTVTTGIISGLNSKTSPSQLSISDKTIITSEIGTLEVFNMQGTQVLRAENTNNVKTNLSNGMYIVRFTDKVGKQLIQKFSIK